VGRAKVGARVGAKARARAGVKARAGNSNSSGL